MKKIIIPCILLLLFGCSGEKNNDYREASNTDTSTAAKYISSSAAVEKGTDPTRKFIRTARLRFKVNNVFSTTQFIEDVTTKQGGFVTYTNLASNISDVRKEPISNDSLLETTYYTVTNNITLRVPNTQLDTTLKIIAADIAFLDYRIIQADEVSQQLQFNQLIQQQIPKNKLLNINATVSTNSLLDQIKYSTVQLDIYQQRTVKRKVIADDENTTAYQQGLGKRLLNSIQIGWAVFENLIVSIFKLWAIILLVLLIYFIYRKFNPRIKKQ